MENVDSSETEELSQEELERQREIGYAQERLASLGELTGSIAHEINNPLAILQMGNYMMKKVVNKEPLDKEKALGIIEENENTIKRVSGLIGSLRNLARKPSYENFEVLPIGMILNDVVQVFSNLFKSKEIDMKVDFESEIFTTPIPLLRILSSQIFINLLNNSVYEIKDSEESWIKVTGELNEKNLVIRFMDSGLGISQKIQEKAFEPFFTTKEIGDGTGLGLSTVKRVMEYHNGDIYIDDQCQNTCFVLLFPRQIETYE